MKRLLLTVVVVLFINVTSYGLVTSIEGYEYRYYNAVEIINYVLVNYWKINKKDAFEYMANKIKIKSINITNSQDIKDKYPKLNDWLGLAVSSNNSYGYVSSIIFINSELFTDYDTEYAAGVLYHEFMHCYLNYKGLDSSENAVKFEVQKFKFIWNKQTSFYDRRDSDFEELLCLIVKRHNY